MTAKLVDVIAINIETGLRCIMATNITSWDAEGFIKMAVMRRGVSEEIYSAVEHGSVLEGSSVDGVARAVEKSERKST